jgi:glutamate synthase (NADPH/NADH) small chain
MADRKPPVTGRFTLPPGRLETQLEEKAPRLTPAEAHTEASRCLYCYDAPCMHACPTHIDIPTFIRKIATGNLEGSARTILEANLLGASCARVCPVEVLCEGECVYTGWGRKPIEIGRLQRFAMDHAASPSLLRKLPATGHSVGCVGAGPASLACAGTLALLGHRVVLYEARPLPGGLNTTGVAPYKMDAETSLSEVAFVEELGVEIRTGVAVGRDVTGKELLERHEAMFLGVGLGADSFLGIPGEQGPGVVGAVEWIERLKTDPALTLDGVRRAAVIGGGNTALDVAREMAQLGVPEVRLVYRRGEAEMKGYHHEWSAARQEGVVLVSNAVVKEVVREGGRAVALRLARAKGGRATGEELPLLPVDTVVLAIGQAKLLDLVSEFPGVAVDHRGWIVADSETGETGNPRVFAGGDARNGGKEVVNAVDEGQRAARTIDALLRNARDE